MPRRNVVTTPSFETGLGDWLCSGAPFDRETSATYGAAAGSYYAYGRNNAAGATLAFYQPDRKIPVTAGTSYAVSASVNRDGSGAVNVGVDWFNAAGAILSNSFGTATPGSGVWARVSTVATAPAGAVTARVWINCVGMAAGYFARLDAVMVEPAVSAVGAYADGDVVGWRWDGTAHASTSTAITPPSVASSSSTRVATNGAAASVAVPAGTAAGDLLVALNMSDSDGSLAGLAAPAGWRADDPGQRYAPGTTTPGKTTCSEIVWRVADGTEGATITFPGVSGAYRFVIVLRIVDANTAVPFAAAPSYGTSPQTATAHVAPSVTAVPAGLLLCGWTLYDSYGSWTVPAGMTQVGICPPSGAAAQSVMASQALSAGGATGTRTATHSDARACLAVAMVIAPAAPAAPAPQTYPGAAAAVSGSLVSAATLALPAVHWKGDYTAATVVAGGWKDDPWQRQNAAGTMNDPSVPWPPATSPASGGRPGREVALSIPSGYRRYEIVPGHRAFEDGESAWFGLAVRLPAGYPIATTSWLIFEQLHQANGDGSPPISFEADKGGFRLTGGYRTDPATWSTNPARDSYDVELLAGVETDRWYAVVYRVENFSRTPGTSKLSVWIDGVVVLSGWTIPPPTIVPATDGSSTGTYRKHGIYASSAVATALTVETAGAATGTSYAEVDPKLTNVALAAAVAVSGTATAAAPTNVALAAAVAVSGTAAAAAPTTLADAGAASVVSASRAAAAGAARTTPAAAAVTSATRAALAPATPAAGAAASGTVAAAGPTVTGPGAATAVSATVASSPAVAINPPTLLAALSGTRTSSGPLLDAAAAAAAVSGTRAGADGVRSTSVTAAAAVSATRTDAAMVTTVGGVGGVVSGSRVDTTAQLSSRGAGAACSGTTASATPLGTTRAVSGTVAAAAPRATVLAAAAAVSATTALTERPWSTGSAAGSVCSATVVGAGGVVGGVALPAAVRSASTTALSSGVIVKWGAAGAVSATVLDTTSRIAQRVAAVVVSGTVVIGTAAAPYRPLFIPPPGPPVARAPELRKRVLVCDTRTGRVHYELPYKALTWASKINGTGDGAVTAPIEDTLEALYEQGIDRPGRVLREIATGGWRYSFAMALGAAVLWAGPLKPSRSVTLSAPEVQIGASEVRTIFTARELVDAAGGNLADEAHDVVFADTNIRWAAYRVVAHAVAGAGRELPMYCTAPPPASGDQSWTYRAYDAVKAEKALADLAAGPDGPDIRFDPGLAVTDDGVESLWWDLKIGDPYLDFGTEWVWDDLTAREITYSSDVVGMASRLRLAGGGQDRDKLIVQATDNRMVDIGYPVLERTESVNDLTDPERAAVLVRQKLDATFAPTEQWTVKVSEVGDPPAGHYRVGDMARLDLLSTPAIDPGTYRQRITALSGDAGPLVSLTVDAGDSSDGST